MSILEDFLGGFTRDVARQYQQRDADRRAMEEAERQEQAAIRAENRKLEGQRNLFREQAEAAEDEAAVRGYFSAQAERDKQDAMTERKRLEQARIQRNEDADNSRDNRRLDIDEKYKQWLMKRPQRGGSQSSAPNWIEEALGESAFDPMFLK